MITREEFLGADIGDYFIGEAGEAWYVIYREGAMVYVALPDNGNIGLLWDDKSSRILDEDRNFVFSLNTDASCLVKEIDDCKFPNMIETRLPAGQVRFLVRHQKKGVWVSEVLEITRGKYDGGWLVSEHVPEIDGCSGLVYYDWDEAVQVAKRMARAHVAVILSMMRK